MPDEGQEVRRAARRVRSRLPTELVESALIAYVAGDSAAVVAATHAISVSCVQSWRRQAGLAPNGRAGQRLPSTEIERVVSVYRRLGSLDRTAREVGRSYTSVRRILERHEPGAVKPRNGRPASRPRARSRRTVLGDVAPLALLLEDAIRNGELVERIADRAALPVRRLNAIRRGEYGGVTLDVADRVCVACGETLAAAYPDL